MSATGRITPSPFRRPGNKCRQCRPTPTCHAGQHDRLDHQWPPRCSRHRGVLTVRGLANDADTSGSPLPGSMVPPGFRQAAFGTGGFAAIAVSVVGPFARHQAVLGVHVEYVRAYVGSGLIGPCDPKGSIQRCGEFPTSRRPSDLRRAAPFLPKIPQAKPAGAPTGPEVLHGLPSLTRSDSRR